MSLNSFGADAAGGQVKIMAITIATSPGASTGSTLPVNANTQPLYNRSTSRPSDQIGANQHNPAQEIVQDLLEAVADAVKTIEDQNAKQAQNDVENMLDDLMPALEKLLGRSGNNADGGRCNGNDDNNDGRNASGSNDGPNDDVGGNDGPRGNYHPTRGTSGGDGSGNCNNANDEDGNGVDRNANAGSNPVTNTNNNSRDDGNDCGVTDSGRGGAQGNGSLGKWKPESSTSNTGACAPAQDSQPGSGTGPVAKGVDNAGTGVDKWKNPNATSSESTKVLNGMIPASSLDCKAPIPKNGGAKKETPSDGSDLMPPTTAAPNEIAKSGPLKGIPNGEALAAAAKKEGVDPYLLAGVATVETGDNANNRVVNDATRKDGLCQVNSGVWHSPENPGQNAQMAAKLIKMYTQQAGGDVARGLNAYNTGSVDQAGYAAKGNHGERYGSYSAGVANAVNNIKAYQKTLG